MRKADSARIAELVNAKLGQDTVHHSVINRVVAAVFEVQHEERQRARHEKAARGQAVGGRVEFGFFVDDNGMTKVYEPEQVMIRRARAMHSKGVGLRTIAKAINAEGHAVSHTTVAKLLRRETKRSLR
jgi:hypothetical protein